MSAVQNPQGSSAETLSIVLTGQALLQSDIRVGWPRVVQDMRPLLKGDVVFTNFETMIVEPGGSLEDLPPNNMGHHGPPEMFDVLTDMGFNLLTTANNHGYDLLEAGVLSVLEAARARNLPCAGTGANLEQATAPAYLDTPQGRVALVGMATGALREDGAATDTKPGVNELRLEGETPGVDAGRPRAEDARRILESITDARKNADIVVSYHHNHVYDKNFVDILENRLPDRLVPPNWIKTWAHQQVDAGADVVVLQGLPIVQGLEIYRGRPIFYDMGNFIFQLDVNWKSLFPPDVYESVVARVEFEDRKLKSITFRPIVLTDDVPEKDGRFISGIPSPATGSRAQSILTQVAELSRAFGTAISIHGDVAEVDLT